MSAIAVGSIIFACVFTGALLGLLLRAALPKHHLNADSKEVVRLGMGLIGTMAALLLGLLVASAKSSYDNVNGEITQISAKILFLDRLMANYGPETKEIRELLRRWVSRAVDQMWRQEKAGSTSSDPTAAGGEAVFDELQALSPQNDAQRSLKAQALAIAVDLGQTRWLLFEQASRSVSMPFLVMVVFWLMVIFASFGLFAPPNATVIATLFLCALSVSGAIYLTLEMDHPFDGLIQIPSESLRNVVVHIGK